MAPDEDIYINVLGLLGRNTGWCPLALDAGEVTKIVWLEIGQMGRVESYRLVSAASDTRRGDNREAGEGIATFFGTQERET